jgi:hypothetical protein
MKSGSDNGPFMRRATYVAVHISSAVADYLLKRKIFSSFEKKKLIGA